MKDIFKKIIVWVLIFLSKLVLKKYKPKIITITGSVGKTSTKDAVFAVLSKFFYVRKSDKNYNSQIGLPLTILGVPNGWNNPLVWFINILKGILLLVLPNRYPSWLVLEVGIGKPGDMEETAGWLKSDIVIITAFGNTPPHIEFFNSKKHLIEEKALLIKTLKQDGFLILNHDDQEVFELKNKTKSLVNSYGFTEGSDIFCSSESICYSKDGMPEGVSFKIDQEGKSLPVMINGVFGRNHIYAVLAALTVSYSLRLNTLESINSIRDYDIASGRLRLLLGVNNSLIIDDTYNSSPSACLVALDTLNEIKNIKRKIAVLGDMLELGRHTEESHKEIGAFVFGKADYLLVVGQRAQFIKDGALEAGIPEDKIFEFSNSFLAGDFLKDFVKEGDLILVKGSQGVRMERAVYEILKDKKNASNLLVRQNKEWLEKN